MTHNNHTINHLNKDLVGRSREYYLKLYGNFKSNFPDIVIKNHDGFNVIREDLLDVGSKCRFGELLFSTIKEDEVVYVQPRFGFAGISLTKLSKMYNKKLTLFMPSSKIISEHQAYCIEHGCKAIFHRVAAMPNLNRLAKIYSKEKNAYFIPFGLTHELVTASIVKHCDNIVNQYGFPSRIWCAISTGVLCRGLQIGFSGSPVSAVAVARNIKDGEKGRATLYSHHKSFHQNVDKNVNIPFDSALNYDAKAYEYMIKYGNKGDWFWNVAGNIKSNINKSSINSYKEWNKNEKIK